MNASRGTGTRINLATYRLAVREYRKNWALLDRFLYDLCRLHPRHDDPGAVRAKVLLIARGFAAGIERQIPSSGKPGSTIEKLAAHLHDRGRAVKVDTIIARLRRIREPLDKTKVASIVEQHGDLCRLLAGVTRDGSRSVPSFASKYLHFHCPVVPMYDKYSRAQAWRLRSKPLDAFPRPRNAQEDYYWHCAAFLDLYDRIRRDVPGVSVRLVDTFLVWLASES